MAPPVPVVQTVRPPALQRSLLQDRRGGWWRWRQWRRRGKWSGRVSIRAEFAVELMSEERAQPSADVDVALGAELDESIMPHVILKYHITAHLLPRGDGRCYK